MKYFVISDIHSCYQEMISALNKANFNAKTDTLIINGDLFDRGYFPYKCLKYVMDLPHKLIIWGNHDMRLYELLNKKDTVKLRDYLNKTVETILLLSNMTIKYESDISHTKRINIDTCIAKLKETKKYKMLNDYFNNCHFAIEFKKLFITHGWIPLSETGKPLSYKNLKTLTFDKWFKASQSNSVELVKNINNYPKKTLLIGHCHAFRIRDYFIKNEKLDFNDLEAYYGTFKFQQRLICIDGCTPYSGIVNVYSFDTDETPITY